MATLTEFNKTYKPFLHDWAVDITKKHEEIHWTEDEADLSEDVSDWKLKLDEGEKEFITNILRLFTQGDVQVGQNYYDFLIHDLKIMKYVLCLVPLLLVRVHIKEHMRY